MRRCPRNRALSRIENCGGAKEEAGPLGNEVAREDLGLAGHACGQAAQRPAGKQLPALVLAEGGDCLFYLTHGYLIPLQDRLFRCQGSLPAAPLGAAPLG
jgi:hypothetical protein